MLGFVGHLYQKMQLPRGQTGHQSAIIPLQIYHPVKSVEEEDDVKTEPAVAEGERQRQSPPSAPKTTSQTVIMLLSAFLAVLGLVALSQATYMDKRAGATSATASSDTAVPQYFQTYPELYAGKLAGIFPLSSKDGIRCSRF